MSLGAAPPLEATAALLLGGGADLPFLGHLRCSVGTDGARLWLTGRLAAAELLRSAQRGGQPGALLRRLAITDPQVRLWLGERSEPSPNLQALLP